MIHSVYEKGVELLRTEQFGPFVAHAKENLPVQAGPDVSQLGDVLPGCDPIARERLWWSLTMAGASMPPAPRSVWWEVLQVLGLLGGILFLIWTVGQ